MLTQVVKQISKLLLMYPYNRFILFSFSLIWSLIGSAQICSLNISGRVIDADTAEPLLAANVYIEETAEGAVTDVEGRFELNALCGGDYHIVISHIGCETEQFYIFLRNDTSLLIEMEHNSTLLENVVVSDRQSERSVQNSQQLGVQTINDNAYQNLSNLISTISGVSTLKNGSGIAKPIVHGLYGNRLTILNNGVAQSGQQWGNDHSPEIDPLVADKIRVIKGVSALAYPGANLGSVVMIEPKSISNEPHLHGKTTYFYESNGRGHGLNTQWQRQQNNWAWKLNGTLKTSGDRRTADYFLRNTGAQEANFALQVEQTPSERWQNKLYFSSFNTNLGILRGSHVGNLTDLRAAFNREEPFFTETSFSRSLSAPKQNVQHQLLKLESRYFIDDSRWLELTSATQLNSRKEFDVRRSGRSEIPALSLRQWTQFLQAQYEHEFLDRSRWTSGIQVNFIDNTNDPKTGILPLIPDHLSYETAAYSIGKKEMNRWTFEAGGRYEMVQQNAVVISRDIARSIERYNETFHNLSASTGAAYRLSPQLSLQYNLGYAARNPAINELYSNGLHQGVSGIEEGSPSLQSEQAIKTTFSFNGQLNKALSFDVLAHYQRIDNFIYLQPQDELRLTIRGAFPVFAYEQTDAQIFGLDVSAHYQLSETWRIKGIYSFLRGDDLSNNLPLINMPPNNLTHSLNYALGKWKKLENIEAAVTSRYVFQQSNLLPEQDFVLPPEAYHLLDLRLASDVQWQKRRLRFFFQIDNVFNTAYRDYLNRQRYFADDWGRNIIIGGSFEL